MRYSIAPILAFLVGLAAASPLFTAEQSLAQPGESVGSAPRKATDVAPPVAAFKSHELEGIMGKEVRSAAGENMGRIVDVVVDRTGQVRAAVIDFGGFLGVGSRKVVVDWAALHFAPEDQPQQIILDLSREQVKAAPEYRSGKPVVVLGSTITPTPEF